MSNYVLQAYGGPTLDRGVAMIFHVIEIMLDLSEMAIILGHATIGKYWLYK